MASYNDPTFVAIALFGLTALLLLCAYYAGQTRLGRILALSSIASVIGADYAMIQSYNGEPELFYERAGPIERRVIQRRGSFEYVDKDDGNGASGGGGGNGTQASAGAAGANDPDVTGGDAGSGSTGNSSQINRSSSSALARLASSLGGAAHAAIGPRRGDELMRDCETCPPMVVIEPGFYRMGAAPGDTDAEPAELPARMITVSRRFAIGRSEVTVAQYMAFARATGRPTPSCWAHSVTDNFAAPISCVTLADATAYIAWLNTTTGRNYRLPTEAEWEWAARAGSQGRYVTSEAPQSPVTNGFGVANLHGGVAEMVAGCWSDTLSSIATDAGSASRRGDCQRGVLRDAGNGEPSVLARLSARRPIDRDTKRPQVGFRLARDL